MNQYQIRLATLGFVVIGGAVLVGTFLFGLQRYFRPAWDESMHDIAAAERQDELASGRSRPPLSLSTDRGRRQALREQHLHEVAQLRAMLEDKTAALRKQQADLEATAAEKDRLEKEIDDYLDLLLKSSAAPNTTALPSAAVTAAEEAAAQRETQAALDAEIGAYIADVASEIQRQQQRIADLEQTLAVEADNNRLATSVIVESGAGVVPILVTMLLDDRPAYRRWAANVLGQMGRSAVPAREALLMISEDDDASVRLAVQTALKQIDQGF